MNSIIDNKLINSLSFDELLLIEREAKDFALTKGMNN
jgi:hypothetical protein